MKLNQNILSLPFVIISFAISDLHSSQTQSQNISSTSSSSLSSGQLNHSMVNLGENRVRTDHGIEAAKGCFNIAKMFQTGINTNCYMAKNEKLAAIFFQLAADLGNARALYELGICYREGSGVKKSPEKAEELFRMAATKGYDRAVERKNEFLIVQQTRESAAIIQKNVLLLGKKYRTGRDVEKDEKIVLACYIIAAVTFRNLGLDCSLGEFELGRCYESGIGVTADPGVAFLFYQRAADHGHVLAQNSLGVCYEKGIGVEINPENAFYYYECAALKDCPEAQYHLGHCYEKGIGATVDLDQAVKFYTKAVEQEHAKAQYALGECYKNSKGVPVADPVKAAELFLQSANQGDADAQFRMAQCYEQGEGVDANPAKAFEYWQLAANQGHEEAKKKVTAASESVKNYASLTGREIYELAKLHQTGVNVAKDEKLAVYLYEIAAKRGYAPAAYQMGCCYEDGIGIDADSTKAFTFYENAAKKGDAQAQNKVGDFCRTGKSFWFSTQYPELAVEWYTKAANQGNARALYNLGTCYEAGCGIAKNPCTALIYFKLAAKCKKQEDQKDIVAAIAEAQKKLAAASVGIREYTLLSTQELCKLAEAFNTGQGAVKDLEMAKELYEVAAKRGHFAARNKIVALDAEIKTAVQEQEEEAKKKIEAEQTQASTIHQTATQSAPITHEQQSVSSTSSSSSSSAQSDTSTVRQSNSLSFTVNSLSSFLSDSCGAVFSESMGSSSSQSTGVPLSQQRRSTNAVQVEDDEFENLLDGSDGRSKVPLRVRRSGEQEAKVKAQAAQENDDVPLPMAFSESPAKELRASALENCPEEITTLIDLWSKYIMALREKDELRCKKLSENLPRRLILVGPPGTGKTLLSKAIADECGMKFFMYFASSLSNHYKNSGLKNLNTIFEQIASLEKPAVLIIDELQALFQQHANKNDVDGNILILFWQLLDQYKNRPLLVIATLNDLSEAPEQLADRCHIDTVEIPLPDEQKRVKLISYYMELLCHTSDESLAKEFAALTKDYSNRALEDFVRLARRQHSRRNDHALLPTKEDFAKALKQIKNTDKLYSKKNTGGIWEHRIRDIGLPLAHLVLGATNSYLGYKYHKEAMESQFPSDWLDNYPRLKSIAGFLVQKTTAGAVEGFVRSKMGGI